MVMRVAAESSQSVSPRPMVSHQNCFWRRTCLTVSSISLKATSELVSPCGADYVPGQLRHTHPGLLPT
jgi:hypothetical protein